MTNEIKLPTKNLSLVGHRTDRLWNPYMLFEGEWFEINVEDQSTHKDTDPEEVQFYMESYGFEVLFEGVDTE